MSLELIYDTRAGQAVSIPSVIREITGTINIEVTCRDVKDEYGIYQIDGKVNPLAIASRFRRGDASTPLRLVLTAYDLKPPTLNFAFGSTWEGVASVVSTHRLEGNSLYAAVTSLHEVFHQVGMVELGKPQYDRRTGLEGHCVNRCLMRPVNSIADLREVANDWRRDIRLCSACTAH